MKSNDTDTLIYIFAGAIFVPPILAKFIPAVRDTLVSWHILATDQVLIPLSDGIGFDLPRILIALSIVGLFIALTVLLLRRRAAKKEEAGQK